MADHWKSIANLVGAPGMDEPEEQVDVVAPAESPQPKAAPAKRSSSKTSRPEVPTKVTEQPGIVDDSAGPTHRSSEPERSEFRFDPNLPIPDEALSFKPSRHSSARAPTQSDPELNPTPAARSFSEPPPPPAPEARREAPSMPDRTEPETPAFSPPAPPKRKSSWESLANMFNLKVDRSKPVAEPESPRPSRPSPAQSDFETPRAREDKHVGSQPSSQSSGERKKLSIFSDESPSDPNAALDSMFGNSPSGSRSDRETPEGWGKPRIIDDLGWDESETGAETPSSSSVRGESHTGSVSSELVTSSDDSESSPGDDDEAPRRGRRRRRGRRGGRGGVEGQSTPNTDAVADDGSKVGWGGFGENESADDDPWQEPESFEEVRSDRFNAGDDSFDDDTSVGNDVEEDELSADGEVLRRSSRRRRRGRGRDESAPRGRDESAPRGRDESAPRGRDESAPRGRGESAPRGRGESAPRGRDEGVSAASKDVTGERLSGRGRPSRPRREVDLGPVGFVSDNIDEPGEGDLDDLDVVGEPMAARRPEPRSDSSDSEERSSRGRRRRRGGSSGGEARRDPSDSGRDSAPGRDRVSRSAGRPSDEPQRGYEEDMDASELEPIIDGEEGDDELASGGKHRSIPTWADSVQSLVEANMENRKRGGDSRGAPRGRPRGRR